MFSTQLLTHGFCGKVSTNAVCGMFQCRVPQKQSSKGNMKNSWYGNLTEFSGNICDEIFC